jgi:hypothetical protein
MGPTLPVAITLDRPRLLRFDLKAVAAFECAAGRNIREVNFSKLADDEFIPLLWACLLYDDPGLTMDGLGKIIHYPGFQISKLALLDAVFSSFPKLDKTEKQAEEGEDEPVREPIDWLAMWAIARYDFQLSDDDFWKLTFAEYDALMRRRNLDREWQDFHAGLICSVLANVNRNPQTKPEPFTPQDFMTQRRHQVRRIEPDTMFATIRALNARYGGEETENG